MNAGTIAHWNDEPSAEDAREDIAVGDALAQDLLEASIVVESVYREYHENGGFLEIEGLLEKHRDLPWYLLKSTGETTDSK